MKIKISNQIKPKSFDEKLTILANLFIDRIIEDNERQLKLNSKVSTIEFGLIKQ